MFTRFIEDEAGATAIEYALVASMMSMAILMGLQVISENAIDMYTKISDATTMASGSP